MRVVAVLTAVVIVVVGGLGVAAWRADAGRGSAAGGGSLDWNLPVMEQISCATATSCLAVGSSIRGTPGKSVPVAQVYDAGTWRNAVVKSPRTSGAPSALLGVSCPTPSYCLAVGEYNSTSWGNPVPYAMAWNGRLLSAVARPPLPRSASLDTISGVSCPKVNSCVVLGHVTSADSVNGTLVWTWDGAKWSTANPSTPDTPDMENFAAIECATATDCVAAGQTADGDNTVPAAARWNGTSFKPLRPPVPVGMIYAVFSGLSCVFRDHCVAVGLGYSAHQAPITSFLEVWNGRTWKLTTWGDPKRTRDAELAAVSCADARDCLAVGSEGPHTDQQAAALTWNGTAWTAVAVPGAGPGWMWLLDGVACSKADQCTAVGELSKAGVPVSDLTDALPIAGDWDGSTWQIAHP
jgi:hypothetical protein